MIKGKNICLRPITREDLPLLEKWTNDIDFNSEWNTFDLAPAGRKDKEFEEHGYLTASWGLLLVTAPDGKVAGTVSYRIEHYGPTEGSRAFEIGACLHRDYRGKGYGTEAQRLLAEYLFTAYPVMRVQASTDVENLAEQRSLEKAGFMREGIVRKSMWRMGAYHDNVLYSLLRTDL